MIILKEAAAINQYILKLSRQGKKIGFVPTMGALHGGHVALIKAAKEKTDGVVCSIFVNPTQFNNPDDFVNYPVSIEKDIQLLEENGADILFLPAVNNIYPDGPASLPHYSLGYLETLLEGAYRPGHYQGVAQVMHCLLQIVQPHFLLLGQKDFQQCLIIKQLINLTGIKTEIIIYPTQREAGGVAMSSRNRRLSAEERKKAAIIYQSLLFIKRNIAQISFAELKQRARQQLQDAGFETDYVEIADAKNLKLLLAPQNGKMIALIAATINNVRLIDNLLL